jgi:serine/threonine-protein kinase
MIGKTISHYKVVQHVGEGGMGAVYKGQDLVLDRPVAIKIINPSNRDQLAANERFIREAKAISQIDHPNVVTLIEVVQEAPYNYLVMQYVTGETLRHSLHKKPFTIQECVRIVCEVASGLEAAHKHRIIHRDIKPENIMITPSGLCKILDFGVAQLVDRSTLTRKGRIVGTLPYMAPEQIRAEKVDVRTDVYALGVLLFELLSGSPPFTSRQEAALLYEILNREPPDLRSLRHEVPEELARIARKALAKNPTQRYQDVTQLLHDLEIIESG